MVQHLRIYICAHAYLSYVARRVFIFGVGFALSFYWIGNAKASMCGTAIVGLHAFLYALTINNNPHSWEFLCKKNLSFMSNKKQNEELQSRRRFFRSIITKALPLIAISSTIIPQIKASNTPMGCEYGCQGSCTFSCSGSCYNSCAGSSDTVHACRECNYSCKESCKETCQNTCKNACRGCSGTCENKCVDSCKGTCSGDCLFECYTSCVVSCKGTCFGKMYSYNF